MRDQMKSVIRAAWLLVAALLLAGAFAPAYRTYFNGLMLGTLVSVVNGWMLMVKIEALTARILNEGLAAKPNKRVNMGFISRISMAILGVMVAVKMPHFFHAASTIAGISFVPAALFLTGFLSRGRK
ncbi:ATP synthase subunit I [Paenibacillus puerhi]|uniref:ATP synthase subunit I n=1 Tax=Paenibacillus puerhi TaxID=2692622 RepID=UPI001358DD55|nr:ATP synthase subunit I [Paenibacillus puerhi]